MASTPEATVEVEHKKGRTFVFPAGLLADGSIGAPKVEPRGTQIYTQGEMSALARCSPKGSEAEARFTSMSEGLGNVNAKRAENTFSPATPGFTPVMPGMKS